MPEPLVLPEALLARFRTVAFERLERIDGAWSALTRGAASPQMEQDLFRDLHTLKGDARVVGIADVAVLCQRLEDLLGAARRRRFRVHEDVDIVVTMAIQFIGMLLRKKSASARGGIDLEGFLKQIEEVLREWMRRSSEAPDRGAGSATRFRLIDGPSRVSKSARERLAAVATSIYMEHLRSSGNARGRLHEVWRVLAREIRELEAVPLTPVLAQHAQAAGDLARELGKQVDVMVDGDDVHVAVEIVDALNTAVLHALRNAVDHGIEADGERMKIGKPDIASVRVSARYVGAASVEVAVRDDGAGVDLARVRARAVSTGALDAESAARATDAQLHELLFNPGFSTRDAATEVSGRGVGMDAVRDAITRAKGTVAIESSAAAGTMVTIRVPQPRVEIAVQTFRVPRTSITFAVDATWAVRDDGEATPEALDLAELLELPASTDVTTAPRTLRLSRDAHSIALAATTEPRGSAAFRLCATLPAEPVEAVEIEGDEAVLIRPDVLLSPPSTREDPRG